MTLGLALLLASFTVLVALDAPIAVALGLASVVYLLVSDLAPLIVVAQRVIAENIANFVPCTLRQRENANGGDEYARNHQPAPRQVIGTQNHRIDKARHRRERHEQHRIADGQRTDIRPLNRLQRRCIHPGNPDQCASLRILRHRIFSHIIVPCRHM